MSDKKHFIPKEISWLSFNERVLQEAADTNNPIIERLRFLGIFSNNQDEFFEVRVGDLRRRVILAEQQGRGGSDRKLLKRVLKLLDRLSEKFDETLANCMTELASRRIHFVGEEDLSPRQSSWLKKHFAQDIVRHIVPILVTDRIDLSQTLQSGVSYLVFQIIKDDNIRYAIVDLPETTQRVLQLPNDIKNKRKYFMWLDDAIRHCFDQIFAGFIEYDEVDAWSMKLSRDAEYTLEDDIEMSLVEKMEAGVKQRFHTPAVRLTLDREMPSEMQNMLVERLKFDTDSDAVMLSGRYRNLKDLLSFPNPGQRYLENPPLPALKSKAFETATNTFAAIDSSDILLYYPYHRFSYFTELLRQAAFDPAVESIKINIYRAAKQSRVIESLLDARRNGKRVTVNIELRARFDEEHNLKLSEVLADAGIKVLFGVAGLKVHSKLCVIKRNIDGELRNYAHIGTGNFNEKTAKIYTDFSLFTADQEICAEVDSVFSFVEQSYRNYKFKHLLVSPLNSRNRLLKLIKQETHNAENKQTATITIKVNNLVDKAMTNALYEASQAGVKVRIIVRGMCELVPGIKGLSDNIQVISIVDRYLEHPRCFVFHNGGDKLVLIGSADLMGRNLDNRVEVICPVYDPKAKKRVLDILDIQFKDTTKARIIDAEQTNHYVPRGNRRKIRSQIATYEMLKAEEK